ncbi:MAG: hypothetical protein R3E32_03270 [Chitinophagales bacterium]
MDRHNIKKKISTEGKQLLKELIGEDIILNGRVSDINASSNKFLSVTVSSSCLFVRTHSRDGVKFILENKDIGETSSFEMYHPLQVKKQDFGYEDTKELAQFFVTGSKFKVGKVLVYGKKRWHQPENILDFSGNSFDASSNTLIERPRDYLESDEILVFLSVDDWICIMVRTDDRGCFLIDAGHFDIVRDFLYRRTYKIREIDWKDWEYKGLALNGIEWIDERLDLPRNRLIYEPIYKLLDTIE